MSRPGSATFGRSVLALTAAILFSAAVPAAARSRFDGTWNLTFMTQRGPCDPSYNFTVDVNNGYVSHPNILTFRGRVMPSGAVRASVKVGDKYAWGSGRLLNPPAAVSGAVAPGSRAVLETGPLNGIERKVPPGTAARARPRRSSVSADIIRRGYLKVGTTV